mmetsp:Transcript_43454/g.77781  ORF Transcript_43454/g.77781 Transcript_43454/m.77781 type:complete len:229 (-) Transcript_43454:92-778(-)
MSSRTPRRAQQHQRLSRTPRRAAPIAPRAHHPAPRWHPARAAPRAATLPGANAHKPRAPTAFHPRFDDMLRPCWGRGHTWCRGSRLPVRSVPCAANGAGVSVAAAPLAPPVSPRASRKANKTIHLWEWRSHHSSAGARRYRSARNRQSRSVTRSRLPHKPHKPRPRPPAATLGGPAGHADLGQWDRHGRRRYGQRRPATLRESRAARQRQGLPASPAAPAAFAPYALL